MKRILMAWAMLLVTWIGAAYATNTFLRDDGTFAFPSGVGNVSGPGSSTSGDFATWNNTAGTLLADTTPTQATASLNVFTSSLKGLAPLSGGGTTNFLRADGTWAAPPIPGLTYLGTVSVSGGTLSDTSLLGSGSFRSYELVVKNIVTVTNGAGLSVQVHSGGVFQTTTYLSSGFQANGSSSASNSLTTGIALTSGTGGLNTAPGTSGKLLVSDVGNASTKHMWTVQTDTSDAGSNMLIFYGGGFWNTNGSINGFQIVASSGALTSGSVDVYGAL